MIAIFDTRQAAKDLAATIHTWRQANVPGYTATSWANCDAPDEEYDLAYKHETEDRWYVPLPADMMFEVETVEALPEGWRTEPREL